MALINDIYNNIYESLSQLTVYHIFKFCIFLPLFVILIYLKKNADHIIGNKEVINTHTLYDIHIHYFPILKKKIILHCVKTYLN